MAFQVFALLICFSSKSKNYQVINCRCRLSNRGPRLEISLKSDYWLILQNSTGYTLSFNLVLVSLRSTCWIKGVVLSFFASEANTGAQSGLASINYVRLFRML